jgi:hypothetical protein
MAVEENPQFVAGTGERGNRKLEQDENGISKCDSIPICKRTVKVL